MNCKTENIIYAIYCKKCSKTVYVGQTGGSLYQRMLLNISRIKNQSQDDPVAQHFCLNKHTIEDFSVTPIERVSTGEIHRKLKKTFWIKNNRTSQHWEDTQKTEGNLLDEEQ